MIESKILKDAVGVARQDVKDDTVSVQLPSTNNAVIVGRFKRGRINNPFKVTITNYTGLLGRDVGNPSFMAVEDALNSGVNELWVLRVGDSVNPKQFEYFDLSELQKCMAKSLKYTDLHFGEGYIPDYEASSLP